MNYRFSFARKGSRILAEASSKQTVITAFFTSSRAVPGPPVPLPHVNSCILCTPLVVILTFDIRIYLVYMRILPRHRTIFLYREYTVAYQTGRFNDPVPYVDTYHLIEAWTNWPMEIKPQSEFTLFSYLFLKLIQKLVYTCMREADPDPPNLFHCNLCS